MRKLVVHRKNQALARLFIISICVEVGQTEDIPLSSKNLTVLGALMSGLSLEAMIPDDDCYIYVVYKNIRGTILHNRYFIPKDDSEKVEIYTYAVFNLFKGISFSIVSFNHLKHKLSDKIKKSYIPKKRQQYNYDVSFELIGVYKYKKQVALIEMIIDELPDNIDFEGIYLGESETDMNSQVPYLEQFLNIEGTERISSIYGELDVETKPTRFTFFLFLAQVGDVITTPYGNITIKEIVPLPNRLKSIIEFEEVE